jgi:transcriptional regulator with XRE-family HTH domain
MKTTVLESGPQAVDVHIGARVRLRRQQIRQSQEGLADAIGLTFQQVQKYERAANRISCSMLAKIARAQNTPISWYWEGVEGLEGQVPEEQDRMIWLSGPLGRRWTDVGMDLPAPVAIALLPGLEAAAAAAEAVGQT